MREPSGELLSQCLGIPLMILGRQRNVVQLGIDVGEFTWHPVVRVCPELSEEARSRLKVDASVQVPASDPLRDIALYLTGTTLQECCVKEADEFVACVGLVEVERDELKVSINAEQVLESRRGVQPVLELVDRNQAVDIGREIAPITGVVDRHPLRLECA